MSETSVLRLARKKRVSETSVLRLARKKRVSETSVLRLARKKRVSEKLTRFLRASLRTLVNYFTRFYAQALEH